MLIEDDKRMLTEEVLGEKWHNYRISRGRGDGLSSCSCGITGYAVKEICAMSNRTFTTWQDLGDLKKKIVEMGEWWDLWWDFEKYCFHEWNKTTIDTGYFVPWLLNPTRFCELVANWWKERR